MALILTRDAERFEVPDRLPVLPLRDVVVFPTSSCRSSSVARSRSRR
jgi:hypothetical protein